MNPITKKQIIMKCLADGDTANLPEPSSKIETYLYIWCKGSGDIPTPANNEEIYFAYLASQAGGSGFNDALPKPESRTEIYLKKAVKIGWITQEQMNKMIAFKEEANKATE